MKKLFFIVAMVALLATGCKKSFLSPEQIDLVYNEVFWKTEKDAEIAVMGTYAL